MSIVVPLYNEARGLARLHAQLAEVAQRLAARGLFVEVVYVDDGSADDTLSIARALPAAALDVQVVALSRNFGKEAALAAGLDHARRGAVLFMDGDGQHPPALIETLVRHWHDDGYDVVYTAKAHRENESATRRFGGKAFYALLNWGARHKIPEDAGDFRLLSPRAAGGAAAHAGAQSLLQGAGELDRLPAEARRLRAGGARARTDDAGRGSLLGLSIEGLTSFSVAPLRLASLLGVLLAFSALVFRSEHAVRGAGLRRRRCRAIRRSWSA